MRNGECGNRQSKGCFLWLWVNRRSATVKMAKQSIFSAELHFYLKNGNGEIYKNSKFTKKVLTKVCGGGYNEIEIKTGT